MLCKKLKNLVYTELAAPFTKHKFFKRNTDIFPRINNILVYKRTFKEATL